MKRWPIIRHIRAMILMWRIERHYERWQKIGAIGVNAERDYQQARRIWRGEDL
jgi:hypothetical protein